MSGDECVEPAGILMTTTIKPLVDMQLHAGGWNEEEMCVKLYRATYQKKNKDR